MAHATTSQSLFSRILWLDLGATSEPQCDCLYLDRSLWVLLYRIWPRCLDAVVIVKPETVLRDRDGSYGSVFRTASGPWE